MNLNIELFSILRDCLPSQTGRASLSLPEDSTLGDLLIHLKVDQRLGLDPLEIISKAGWQILVNGRIARNTEDRLKGGDLVQIFPPMAGG